MVATRKKKINFDYPDEKPLRLKDVIEKDAEVDIPQYVYNRINGKYRDKPIISDPDMGDLSPTCVSVS